MNDNVYNRCLRIAKLACNNTRYNLCVINKIPNLNSVQVKVRSKEQLAVYIDKIMHSSQNAMSVYRPKIQALLVIETSDRRLQNVMPAGEIFVKSVLKSRDSRICQKQLIDLLAAEKYLQLAALYDKRKPFKQLSESALEFAKNVVFKMHSANFLNSFSFDGKPHVDEKVRMALEAQAFDKNYALGTQEATVSMADAKYANDFASRKDFFIVRNLRVDDTEMRGRKNMMSLRDREFTPESLIISDLYKGTFANLSSQKKVRRFVNLKAKNRDIEICPPRNLLAKRQFATIDAMTMHRYIYDFYTDRKPANLAKSEWPIYYFKQELLMYRRMWGSDTNVIYRSGKLLFADGSEMKVPTDITPHECFHRVNAAYGALFGFSPDDMKGDWMLDSIRQSYTAEGMAEYRLAMIDAKMKGY